MFYRFFLYLELKTEYCEDVAVTDPDTLDITYDEECYEDVIKVSSIAQYVSFIFGYWLISFMSLHVSGAHYNPAVTFAFFFKRDTNFSKILSIFYIIA
jgi:glycerol uptake facilitator-like aquaporin